MKLAYLIAAEREVFAAAESYELASPGVGYRFLAAVDAAIDLVRRHNYAGKSVFRDQPNVREYVIRNFPWWLIYQVGEDQLTILALAHQSRRPDYWRNRVQEESAVYPLAA